MKADAEMTVKVYVVGVGSGARTGTLYGGAWRSVMALKELPRCGRPCGTASPRRETVDAVLSSSPWLLRTGKLKLMRVTAMVETSTENSSCCVEEAVSE